MRPTRCPLSLSLGMRQRLQLAVAVIHSPDMLILDEPTSGVDPIARDIFWELLIELSRKDGVTIFISTHFVNEAERCDRVSLMHAGRILALGEPSELREARHAATLSEAFIDYLEDADRDEDAHRGPRGRRICRDGPDGIKRQRDRWLSPARIWAFARRETLELVRDPIRITFALLGPVVLLLAMAYGISFDLENVRYAVLDRDQSQESATLGESFSASRYFEQRAPLAQRNRHRYAAAIGGYQGGHRRAPRFRPRSVARARAGDRRLARWLGYLQGGDGARLRAGGHQYLPAGSVAP